MKRAKETAAVLSEIESYVEKQAWPYVRNELRSEFGYLRYDLETIINSKPKAERKALLKDVADLIESIEKVSSCGLEVLDSELLMMYCWCSVWRFSLGGHNQGLLEDVSCLFLFF